MSTNPYAAEFAEQDAAALARPANRDRKPAPAAMVADDPFPPGPYSLDLTGYGEGRTGRPWIIRCGDGRCIAGWINSRACAHAIVAALNAQYPT